jgi:ribonuclease VapC
MVIDSSALLSILLGNDDASQIATAFLAEPKRLISAPTTLLETSTVIEARKGPAGGRELDLLLHSARIEVASMTLQQVDIAREAYRRYGKGRHPAKLNMGDCCSYALARHSGERLLFKGEAFSHSDIPVVALPS